MYHIFIDILKRGKLVSNLQPEMFIDPCDDNFQWLIVNTNFSITVEWKYLSRINYPINASPSWC